MFTPEIFCYEVTTCFYAKNQALKIWAIYFSQFSAFFQLIFCNFTIELVRTLCTIKNGFEAENQNVLKQNLLLSSMDSAKQ